MKRAGPRRRDVVRELACFVRPGPGPLGDPDVGWDAMLAVAADHRLLPAVWAALRQRGVPSLPEQLAHLPSPLAILHDSYRTNMARVADLRGQLADVLHALDRSGVDALPIKGAHWLLAGIHPDPAARVTIDLDVIVPDHLASTAVAVLAELGYRHEPEPADREPTDHQLDPLYAPGRLGSIELHREPMVAFRRRLVTTDELWASATTVVVDGRYRRVPSPTHLMVVLIGHAQLQDDGARLLQVPLRALHDLALLGDRAVTAADWGSVAEHFDRLGPGGRLALAGFAAASASLFGVELPVRARGGRTWLRATDVALDHPTAARQFRRAAYLPRALRTERMVRLYGVAPGPGVWRARLTHLTPRRRHERAS